MNSKRNRTDTIKAVTAICFTVTLCIFSIYAINHLEELDIDNDDQNEGSEIDDGEQTFGPGIGSNSSLEMTLEVAETPTVGGGFKVRYDLTNLGEEKVLLDLPAKGKNFNIYILTPNSTEISFIGPLSQANITQGTVNSNGSLGGYILLENNEKQKWGDAHAAEVWDDFYQFPVGEYKMYADYGNGAAFSEVVEFEILPNES